VVDNLKDKIQLIEAKYEHLDLEKKSLEYVYLIKNTSKPFRS
jgi:hypothetical protein